MPIKVGEQLIDDERDFELPYHLIVDGGKHKMPPPWTKIKKSTVYFALVFHAATNA